MIHRTFRSLDQAPKLVGFTLRQWLWLLLGGGAMVGLILAVHLSTRPAITLLVFTVGLPAALAYVSESGGLALGALLLDMVRWRLSRHALPPTSLSTRAPRALVLVTENGAQIPAAQPMQAFTDTSASDFWERWR